MGIVTYYGEWEKNLRSVICDMFSKLIDLIADFMFGNLSRIRNKRIYIISTLLLVIVSSSVATNILKLNIDLSSLSLDHKTSDITNSLLGLIISGTFFLYSISIGLFIVFLAFEILASETACKMNNKHNFLDEKMGVISSWFLHARLGVMQLSSKSYDYLLIGILFSIILRLSHHTLILDYFIAKMDGSSITSVIWITVFLFSVCINTLRVFKAIHYHFFHFQSQLRN